MFSSSFENSWLSLSWFFLIIFNSDGIMSETSSEFGIFAKHDWKWRILNASESNSCILLHLLQFLPLMNPLVEPAARTKLSFKMWRAPDSDIIFPQALKKANSIWKDPSVAKMSNSGDYSACIWRAVT